MPAEFARRQTRTPAEQLLEGMGYQRVTSLDLLKRYAEGHRAGKYYIGGEPIAYPLGDRHFNPDLLAIRVSKAGPAHARVIEEKATKFRGFNGYLNPEHFEAMRSHLEGMKMELRGLWVIKHGGTAMATTDGVRKRLVRLGPRTRRGQR